MVDQPVQLVVGRPAVALVAFADHAQPLQPDASEFDLLDRHLQAVDRCGVGQH